MVGARWMLHNGTFSPGQSPPQDSGDDSDSKEFCLGHVDVEGGVSFPYPSSPGRVVEVKVKEGDTVKAGTVLFRMDETLAQAQVAEAEAAIKGAEAQLSLAKNAPQHLKLLEAAQAQALKAMKSKLASARIIADRKRDLVQKEQLAKEEADAAAELVKEAEAAVEGEENKLKEIQLQEGDLPAKIQQAEQDVAHKKALLKKAQFALAECLVKAPMDGMVLRLALQPQDKLPAEPKIPPLIFCPSGPRIIRAEVEQEGAARVAVGQTAIIEDETNSSGGPKWEGKVVRVADWMAHRRSILPDPSQFIDVRTLECIVQIDPSKPPPRIGQRVRVILRTKGK
jgi:multidrug resistance efflux pump